MKKLRINPVLLISCLMAAWIILGIYRLDKDALSQGASRLEESLRRAAVSCYAQEGFYPPDAEYLAEHFAISYDEDSYLVHYEYSGSNLIPQISVHLKP